VLRRRAYLAAVLGAMAAVLLPGTAHAADAVDQPTETPPAELALLTAATVQPEDLAPPYEITQSADGTTVKGAVTLDFCGAIFPSEDLRSGRLQVGIRNATTTQTVASVEAVSYRDAAGATQALDELSRARRACPKGRYVDSTLSGLPPSKWKFAPAPDAKWDDVNGVRRQAYDVQITEPQSRPIRAHLVYFQHGRFLIGVYGPAANLEHIVAPDLDGEAGLAVALSDRLARLPPS
jgi:hypothetical protein